VDGDGVGRFARAGRGELLAGAAGVLLLAATFLPWFGLDSAIRLPGRPGGVTVHGEGVSAWQAFSAIDVVLLVGASLALALPAAATLRGESVRGPLAFAVIVVAALCALLVVLRLLDPPDLVAPVDAGPTETGRRIGPFFALLAIMGMGWGGLWALTAAPAPAPAPEPEPAPAAAPESAGPPIRSAGVAEFEKLTAQLEPLLRRLWEAPAASRAEHGTIPAAPGVYLFTRRDEPVHVGQAADLRKRLAEQCRPSSGHTRATLAFAIARRAARREGIDVDGPPARLATSDEFVPFFDRAKEAVAALPVRYLEVDSPELRQLFEVYGTLALGTGDPGAG
jgi:hypothetical protein